MFEPVNDLEKSLMSAATDPSSRPQFYRDLLTSELYILNQKGDELNVQNNVLQQGTQLHIQSFERDGQTWLPIFTSLERLEKYIRSDSNYLQLQARDFFEMTRGAHVILNPGSPYGKEFLPEEIEQLLDGSIFKPLQTYITSKDTNVLIGQPAVYPNELVRVLSAYFEKNPHVNKAYLMQYFNQETDEKPHLLIALAGKGDWQQVVGDAGMIASEVIGTGEVVDFIRLDQSDFSKSIIRQAKPFYQRSLFGKLFG